MENCTNVIIQNYMEYLINVSLLKIPGLSTKFIFNGKIEFAYEIFGSSGVTFFYRPNFFPSVIHSNRRRFVCSQILLLSTKNLNRR